MDTIRYFKLKNTGGFVARLYVEYRPNGENNWKSWSPSGYSDICAKAERTQDLTELGIADGSSVRLKAFVALGTDKTASEEFTFSSRSGETASYTISGTTLSSKLKLDKGS